MAFELFILGALFGKEKKLTRVCCWLVPWRACSGYSTFMQYVPASTPLLKPKEAAFLQIFFFAKPSFFMSAGPMNYSRR